MIQRKEELDKWHDKEDPWGYNDSKDDIIRKNILLSEIPDKTYKNVLDIGCGQGFITKDLPGEIIYGVDISQTAIDFANKVPIDKLIYKQGSIFEIDKLFDVKFDLIIITGVLYPQYIGKSSNLIYLLIDKILNKNGIVVSVHINEWYDSQLPYLKISQMYYDYRQYTHNLEIYSK
jgi:2-polyprenyl-3-methyl-5-hydroxy-6-metoxy-1,4-benzoquinol methylase